VDGIQGMGDVLVFGGGRRYFEKIQSLSHELTSTQKQMAGLTAWQSTGNNLLANLAMWSVLVITIPLVNAGKIEGIFLAVLVLASLTSFEAVASLSLAAQYLGNNLQAAHRLFSIVDAKPPVTDPPSTLSLPQDFSLEVKNLSFCYPELQFQSDELVEGLEALHGVAFSLPYRKRMAIVGPSGSGKSTIGNLLLRFWDHRIDDSANNGQILLAGKDIRLYRQEDIRSLIGFVSQHTHLFAGTLRDNLLLAKPEATHEEIAMAVQKARLNDFINSLPEGYNTWIGEQGWNLSAGERQRVAIARALLKNAPILLLDEPTANLDALTERRIITTFLDLMENRSTLLITNHLVGMEAMDEILVLERGEVIERGQHQELLEFQGLYRQMWDLQKQVLAKEF
jgi:ABC-type transport system involved in cytochrome bd biosynthesis fused ATPase/permease subunit